MSDRELLEAAAKAVGYYFHGHRMGRDPAGRDYKNCYVSTTNDTDDWFVWSPLTDDGDALRLVVRLGLAIDRTVNRCWVYQAGLGINGTFEEYYGDDPYAATRRAIVRAAAAIGEQK